MATTGENLTEARDLLCQAHKKIDVIVGSLKDPEHSAALMARADLQSLISRIGNLALMTNYQPREDWKRQDEPQGDLSI